LLEGIIMKISIITVCFNSAATIGTAIQSVLDQDYDNIEYIIIDGKSTDNTLEVIESFGSGVSKVISEKDKGIYDAINKGIEAATGDFVGLLHSDDFFADSHVISKIAAGLKASQADAVYSDLVYVAKEQPDKVIRNWKSGTYEHGMFFQGWMPPHPTFYVRRSLYHELGMYNLNFSISADYELMLRFIHKHQIKVHYIPEVLLKMRVGGKSNVSIKNRIQANLEDRRAWKINGLKAGMLTAIMKPLSKLKQF